VRVRLLCVALMALLAGTLVSALAPSAAARPAGRIFAQETDRTTATQPTAGQPFQPTSPSRPWSVNWVARPLLYVITPIFLLAIAVGVLVRWIGLGRRA